MANIRFETLKFETSDFCKKEQKRKENNQVFLNL